MCGCAPRPKTSVNPPTKNRAAPAAHVRKKVTMSASSYVCPITLEPIVDPVCTSSGSVFERAALTQWLLTDSSNKDPLTGEPLFRTQDGVGSWSVRKGLFDEHVRKQTVASDLRKLLLETTTVPSILLSRFRPMTSETWRTVLHFLKSMSTCTTIKEAEEIVCVIAGIARKAGTGIPNDALAAFFRDSVEGRVLTDKLEKWTTVCDVLVRFLWRPNEMTDLRDSLRSGFCYYGAFGDTLRDRELLDLIRHNRGLAAFSTPSV